MSSIGNSTSQKSSLLSNNFSNKDKDNFNNNCKNPIKTIEQNDFINGQHKKCYNYNSSSLNKINSNTITNLPTATTTTGVGSNTILITHNYSQDLLKSSDLVKKNLNNSSITIVTTHNNNSTTTARDINSTTNCNNDNSGGYNHLSKMHPINGKNDSNRVSSPVIVDSINICINNHFNDMSCKTITKSDTDNITKFIKQEKTDDIEPDSTTTTTTPPSNNNVLVKTSQQQIKEFESTKKNIFINGMDVLVLKKDEKFYLGTIVAVYPIKLKCLVKFDDGSEYWAEYNELKLFGSNNKSNDLEDSDPMCVICKKINKNDIVELCERCGRGCHRQCAEGGYNNGIWSCKRCTAENGLKQSETTRYSNSLQLPYDLNALNWDGKHHVNEEQIYCYCGKTGRWEKKMLQCGKCEQWFHENCIRCLKNPLYNGDRFYIFVCSICNNGTEFVRRLEMKWIDIVHLILYNLTTNSQDRKYHHITKTIVPYAIDNWSKLQLQNSLKNLSSNEIKENILKTLTINENRFKSGREIKKNNSFWGLRSRIPTVPPKIVIPPDINITEQYIKQNFKINFIPTKYANYIIDETNSSDLKFSSEDEIPIKNIIKKDNKNLQKSTIRIGVNNDILLQKKHKSNTENKKLNIKEQQNHKNKSTYLSTFNNNTVKTGGGVASIKKLNLIKNKIGQKNIGNNIAIKKKLIKSIYNKNSNNNINNNNNCDSSDETSSIGTLDLIIPPPQNFQGRNNPFRFTPKKNETNYNNLNINILNNNNNNYNINKNFDITSKMVALKKSGNGGNKFFNCNNILNETYLNNCGGGIVSGDFPNTAAGQFRIVRTVKRRLSAKDLVIGPNKEIKRRRLRRSSGNVEVISTTIQSLPRKGNNNFMPLIRQEPLIKSFKSTSSSLCTNTILSSSSSSSSSSNTPLATTPTIQETIINSTAVNLFNSTGTTTTTTAISRRNLRKREEKNYSESHRRNSNSSVSTNCSNTSNNNGLGISTNSTISASILNTTTINTGVTGNSSLNISKSSSSTINYNHEQNNCSISDLQSSVNIYFGAIERIKNGEKFSVKAKRILPNGKTQYLVEWDVGGGIPTMN